MKNCRNDLGSVSTNLSFETFGDIVSSCIKKAFSTLSIVCGFVIIFSLIISMIRVCGILNLFNNIWIEDICLGILEITTGIQMVSSISASSLMFHLVATAFLLGFGGISVSLQVWSVISKTDLSIKPYIIGKLLQGTTAALYTFAFISTIPMFNFNL